MDAPAVRYTTAEDGVSIAYGVCGSGYPLVCMPPGWSHFARLWTTPVGQLWKALAQRFSLILYDGRGQGSSQRGLKDAHCLADYEHDLRAVLAAAGYNRATLLAMSVSTRVARRYAAANVDQIDALVLWGSNARPGWATESFATLARLDWDHFIRTASRIGFPFMEPAIAEDVMRLAVSQRDWISMAEAMAEPDDDDIDSRIEAPVLVANPSSAHPLTFDPDGTRGFARRFNDVRLVTLDEPDLGLVSVGGGKPRLAVEVERFVCEVVPGASVAAGHHEPLTERELDVLRLVAMGMTNAQIAKALFISPNTVAKHVASVLNKSGAANRSEAATLAVRSGLI